MANLRSELRSRHAALRRLYDDIKSSSFARLNWDTEVRARRTLGTDDTIEHWFLAEHFLISWSNWRGLLDRFGRYFGQSDESFPKTWYRFVVDCDVLVFDLARQKELDGLLAESWTNLDFDATRPNKRSFDDVTVIYTQLATSHERAELWSEPSGSRPSS
jgi:hypothetical protein